jgi:protein O-mannosyl-transferase
MMNSREKTIRGMVLVSFGACLFFVFMPLLFNGFIDYDDHPYVTENLQVRNGLTPRSVWWAFTSVHSYNWHPVTWISHMLDVQLYGLNPSGHHLTSVLFHIANSLLLFAILEKMTSAFWRSLCVAMLFAVHPLHVESVAWVAERKDVLSTFFGLLAIWSYIKFTKNPNILRYLVPLFFFTLSLMAKSMLVTLPFVLLLLDYWPLRRWSPGHSNLDNASGKSESHSLGYLIWEKIPFFFLAMASSVVIYWVQQKEGAINRDTSLFLNIGNALISYIKYIVKMFWPNPLAVIYPFNPDQINSLNVTGSILILVVVSYLFIRQRRKRPYLAVGWIWYVGTLVPVIGIIRIGNQAIADRYTYIPLIGLFIGCVWGIGELAATMRIKKGLIAALCIALFAALSFFTVKQERYWHNSFVLFEHAIEVTDDNPPAHEMLGIAYGSFGNVEKATSERNLFLLLHYQYLNKVKPNDYEVHYRLGNAYRDLLRYDEAIREYLISIGFNKNSKTYNNLGIAYYNIGNIVEAKRAFTTAVILDPKNKEALNNLDVIGKLIKQHDNRDTTRPGQQ